MSFTGLRKVKSLSMLMVFFTILPLACGLFDHPGPSSGNDLYPTHQHDPFECGLDGSVYIRSSQELDYSPAIAGMATVVIGGLLPGYEAPIYVPPEFIASVMNRVKAIRWTETTQMPKWI